MLPVVMPLPVTMPATFEATFILATICWNGVALTPSVGTPIFASWFVCRSNDA